MYYLRNDKLNEVDEERDLWVIMQSTLKCAKVVKSANATLGVINRTFMCINKEVIILLYKTLVRPKLEFCIQAWSPHLQKDVTLLEKLQHRVSGYDSGFVKNELPRYVAISEFNNIADKTYSY